MKSVLGIAVFDVDPRSPPLDTGLAGFANLLFRRTKPLAKLVVKLFVIASRFFTRCIGIVIPPLWLTPLFSACLTFGATKTGIDSRTIIPYTTALVFSLGALPSMPKPRKTLLPVTLVRKRGLFANHWFEDRLELEPECKGLRGEAREAIDRLDCERVGGS